MQIQVPVLNEDGSLKFEVSMSEKEVQTVLQFGLNMGISMGIASSMVASLAAAEKGQEFND